MSRIILTITIIGATVTPALAMQTEVDPQTMYRKRIAKVEWDERQQRARERQAEVAREAAAAASVDAPEPVAPEPATYPSGVLSAEQVAGYARGAGFPEDVIPTMVAIAFRESRFNPAAINPSSGACGLWQMYPCPGSHALDPATNASMAFSKYQAAGLSPWGY